MNREEYISILETDNASYKKENKQLQSNWNSLREWVEDLYNKGYDIKIVLDKMNELEGEDK